LFFAFLEKDQHTGQQTGQQADQHTGTASSIQMTQQSTQIAWPKVNAGLKALLRPTFQSHKVKSV